MITRAPYGMPLRVVEPPPKNILDELNDEGNISDNFNSG